MIRKLKAVARRAREIVGRQRTLARIARRPTVPARSPAAVLFFTPEAGIVPHFAAQCLLARSLQDRGHRVLMARCHEIFYHCPVFTMHRRPYEGADPERPSLCLDCASKSFGFAERYGLPAIDLRLFADADIDARVRAATASMPDDLRTFTCDGVAFGKLCVMDVVLSTKISDFDNVPHESRQAWLRYIETSIQSYLIVQRLLDKVEIRALVHHNDYSISLGARVAAEKRGIPCISAAQPAHRNVDRRRQALRRSLGGLVFARQSLAWPDWRDCALTASEIKDIADDTIMRFKGIGSHVYSSAKTFDPDAVRHQLRLDPDRTLLVAYTSSLDELIATRMNMEGIGAEIPTHAQPFVDHVDWLTQLTQYVEGSADLQLVVRVHPREGVDHRNPVVSQHLGRLKAAFDHPFEHCRFVWPEDKTSSYDLAEIADVALTSWSSIGLEVSRVGVPVAAAMNGLLKLPEDDFMRWGATPDEYFKVVRSLAGAPASIDALRHAYRWHNLLALGTSVRMEDVVPRSDFMDLPEYHTPAEAGYVERVVIGGEDTLDINLQRLKDQQSSTIADEERRALIAQMARIVHFVHTGEDIPDGLVIAVRTDKAESVAGEVAEMSVEGGWTTYSYQGKTVRRYSPLCARLAPICALAE